MNNKRISIDLPTDKENTVIEVIVRYDIGGDCSFQQQNVDRGYYLGVGVVTLHKNPSGSISRGFGLFSFPTAIIESASKFNQKRLKTLAECAAHTDLLRTLMSQVIKSSKLLLVNPPIPYQVDEWVKK